VIFGSSKEIKLEYKEKYSENRVPGDDDHEYFRGPRLYSSSASLEGLIQSAKESSDGCHKSLFELKAGD
jgi:hypothetical protein